jgi:ubiquinone/menaquinone biosynthesis C-methylase UbiE
VDKIIAKLLYTFGFKRIHGPSVRDTVNLPYFDELLKLLGNGNNAVEQSFGRHVHWGYWENPQAAGLSGADFAEAAENLSRELCRAASLHDGITVLDAGCGFGGTIAHMNDTYADLVLIGLNLDARQLRRAGEQVIPRPRNRIDFVQGNACRLPFPDHCFDVVLAVECIFHFPSREQFFREARRVLKPDGILALSDFLPAQVIVPFAKIRLPERLSRGFYGKCNVQYTFAAYRQLADDSGFMTQAARDITANTLPTYSYLRKLAGEADFFNGYAMVETATLELLSRLRLIRYYLMTFQKKE